MALLILVPTYDSHSELTLRRLGIYHLLLFLKRSDARHGLSSHDDRHMPSVLIASES